MLRFVKSLALASLFIVPVVSSAKTDADQPDRTFLDTTELTCISDGIEAYTGQGAGHGLRPSAKYLGLVAFAMQRFHRGVNGNAGTGQSNYQQRVIEFIQANGFCIENQVDSAGRAKPQDGYGGVKGSTYKAPERIARIVLGTGSTGSEDKVGQSNQSEKDIEKTVKFFGFKKMEDIKDIFYDDNFSGMTPEQRQQKFKAAIENVEKYETGLNHCFNQMVGQQQRSPIFMHKGQKRTSASIPFCEKLADECGLQDKGFCKVSVQAYTKATAPAGPVKGGSSNQGSGPSIYDGAK